jgi:hypothetical protein
MVLFTSEPKRTEFSTCGRFGPPELSLSQLQIGPFAELRSLPPNISILGFRDIWVVTFKQFQASPLITRYGR